MLKKSDIRGYQVSLIEEIKARARVLLAVDMGLGKTISCLTAVQEMPEVKKVLVVAPLRVAHTTWPEEFANWEHLSEMSYTVIKGNEKQRLKCLDADTQFYIVNRENIPWMLANCFIKFDMLIWDESSSLKGAKMKTPKGELTRFGALMKMTESIPRVVLLTGTPTPNGLQDIFGQVMVVDRGMALGRSKNKFMQEYFIDKSRDPMYQIWEARASSHDIVMKKIEDLVIKMKSEDYITLPDFIPSNIFVDMSATEARVYKDLQDNFLLKDEHGSAEIVAVNKAVLMGKLLQLCTGSVYLEDGGYKTFHAHKLDALKRLVDDDENAHENFLVFYNYKHEKEQIEKMFPEARFMDDSALADWNAGKVRILACHPASAGHGLNLQHGGSIMVWMSLPWSLELYQQANKRLHRSGQQCAVRCFHMITRGTVDEYVLKILQAKDARQELILKLMNDLTQGE